MYVCMLCWYNTRRFEMKNKKKETGEKKEKEEYGRPATKRDGSHLFVGAKHLSAGSPSFARASCLSVFFNYLKYVQY